MVYLELLKCSELCLVLTLVNQIITDYSHNVFADLSCVFQISTADETSFCGRITKQWSGLAKEAFTDADNYGISFPIDLDINIKAILMGAVFLIVSKLYTQA